MKRISICLVALVTLSGTAHADWLVQDAKITRITNSSSNTDSFTMSTEGGTGLCSSVSIAFPADGVSSAEIHKRAFSMALAAYTTGDKVSIYSYSNQECNKAGYIELNK